MILKIDENIKQVLGCIMYNPNILNDTKYNLDVEDFILNNHKILFSCLYNMNKIGVSDSISENQLISYLKDFNINWFNIYNNLDASYGDLKNIISNCKHKNFEYNYNKIKKNSLLKDLKNGGWDISRIYDCTHVNTELNMDFETKTIEELLDSLFVFNSDLRKKWTSSLDEDSEMTDSGEAIDELLLNFQMGQTFGVKLLNPVINSIAKGAREGELVLFGASSGAGKSRVAIANACNMAMPFKYHNNQWVNNGLNEKVLVITTELLREEIQSMMLACISKINENKIKYFYNDLLEEEKNRLVKSSTLLKEYPIQICHLPNYNLNDLEIIIEEYVLKYGIKYIFFDYVHLTAKTIEQLKGVSRDIIILQIMTTLKNIANKHKCFIWVGSQLNRSANNEGKDSFSAFSNAQNVGDKTTMALLVTKPTSDEVDKLYESLKHISGFRKFIRPNLIQTVIKNRGGQNAIRIWVCFNHGTLEEEVIAVTDLENNPITVDIVNQNEGVIEDFQVYLDWLNSPC